MTSMHPLSGPARFAKLREQCGDKPHGIRARYASGCRCMLCRAANSRYESDRQRARVSGDWNGCVDAKRAREHLEELSRRGIGRHSVQAACDVSDGILYAIITGTRSRIRARTERRILAVDEGSRAGGSLVDADKTWRIINELVRRGYSKKQLAKWMGLKTGAIQFRRDDITARTEVRVHRLKTLIDTGRLSR